MILVTSAKLILLEPCNSSRNCLIFVQNLNFSLSTLNFTQASDLNPRSVISLSKCFIIYRNKQDLAVTTTVLFRIPEGGHPRRLTGDGGLHRRSIWCQRRRWKPTSLQNSINCFSVQSNNCENVNNVFEAAYNLSSSTIRMAAGKLGPCEVLILAGLQPFPGFTVANLTVTSDTHLIFVTNQNILFSLKWVLQKWFPFLASDYASSSSWGDDLIFNVCCLYQISPTFQLHRCPILEWIRSLHRCPDNYSPPNKWNFASMQINFKYISFFRRLSTPCILPFQMPSTSNSREQPKRALWHLRV